MSLPIELFRCDPLKARISARQCAANYRAANGFLVRGSESRAIGLGPCKDCAIGFRNSGGWEDPRTKGRLSGTREERIKRGWELILTRKHPITTVERMAGVNKDFFRYRIEAAGMNPKDWPHSQTHAIPQSRALKMIRKQMGKTDQTPRPLMARRRRHNDG